MTPIIEIDTDIRLFLKLVGEYEHLEFFEFYIKRDEYEDLGGIYGTSIRSRMNDVMPISFDEKIIVTGHLRFLPYLDYLSIRSGGAIMNQKMLDALLSVREFPYEKLPCRIMDIDQLKGPREFRKYADDALAAQYPHNDEYFFLHLTSYTDLPQGLQTESADLPPILIPDPKNRLFSMHVTQQGKDALIAAQIHGVDFVVPYVHQEPLHN